MGNFLALSAWRSGEPHIRKRQRVALSHASKSESRRRPLGLSSGPFSTLGADVVVNILSFLSIQDLFFAVRLVSYDFHWFCATHARAWGIDLRATRKGPVKVDNGLLDLVIGKYGVSAFKHISHLSILATEATIVTWEQGYQQFFGSAEASPESAVASVPSTGWGVLWRSVMTPFWRGCRSIWPFAARTRQSFEWKSRGLSTLMPLGNLQELEFRSFLSTPYTLSVSVYPWHQATNLRTLKLVASEISFSDLAAIWKVPKLRVLKVRTLHLRREPVFAVRWLLSYNFPQNDNLNHVDLQCGSDTIDLYTHWIAMGGLARSAPNIHSWVPYRCPTGRELVGPMFWSQPREMDEFQTELSYLNLITEDDALRMLQPIRCPKVKLLCQLDPAEEPPIVDGVFFSSPLLNPFYLSLRSLTLDIDVQVWDVALFPAPDWLTDQQRRKILDLIVLSVASAAPSLIELSLGFLIRVAFWFLLPSSNDIFPYSDACLTPLIGLQHIERFRLRVQNTGLTAERNDRLMRAWWRVCQQVLARMPTLRSLALQLTPLKLSAEALGNVSRHLPLLESFSAE